jgi:hypothetical protein
MLAAEPRRLGWQRTQLHDGIVPVIAADGAAAVHLPRGKMIGRRHWRFSKINQRVLFCLELVAINKNKKVSLIFGH